MELFDTDALTELSSMLDSMSVTHETASMSSSNSTLYGNSSSMDPLEGPNIWSPTSHNTSGISYGSPPADRSFEGSNLWSPTNFNNPPSPVNSCGSPPDKQPSEGANGSHIWSPSSPTNNNSSSYSYPSSPLNGSGLLGNSNSPLSAKQTIQCLSFIRELQEQSQNNNQWDINRANETASLTSALQQHLLAHLLKQQPTSSPIAPSYNGNNHNHHHHNNNNNNNNYSNGNYQNGNYQNGNYKNHENLHRNPRFHRDIHTETKCTWSGQLPPRNHKSPVYSCKVFLGGVPFEISMASLQRTFRAFGNVKIEWPGKEDNPPDPKGYAYLIYENERQVKALLQSCVYQYGKEGNWYYKVTSKRMRFSSKDVQVIPWALCDSNFVRCQTTKLDPQKTIFVGALHGMINAEGLALIMQELFGGVIYAGIDTDRNKYPIGSARVTFNNHNSYMKAVAAAFVEIRTSKFTKKVQVDPYLEDATCSVCGLQQGPYFCRDLSCFRYFCRTCFEIQHSGEPFQTHRPLMRNASRQQRSHSSTSTSSGGSSTAPGCC